MRPRLAAFLIGANLSLALGYGAVLPLLPVLLPRIGAAQGIAAAAIHTGGLTGVYLGAVFVGSIAWGRAARRIGPRTTVLIGLGGYALALLLIPAATTITQAYGCRALAGLLAGAVVPVVEALTAAEPHPSRRARVFAATGAATLIGLLLGPVLSGGVARLMQRMESASDMAAMTLLWAMAAVALVALAVAAVAARVPDLPVSAEHRVARGSAPAAALRPHAGVLAANFLVLLGLGAFEVMMPLLGERFLEYDPGAIALVFAECSALMLAVQGVLFLTPVLSRVAPRVTVATGFAIMASGMAGLGLARSDGAVLAASALLAASSGWLLPAIGYLATIAERGGVVKLLAALTAAGILGQASGSALGGWLYGRATGAGFGIIAAALAAGMAVALRREFDFRAHPKPAPGEHHQAVGHGP